LEGDQGRSGDKNNRGGSGESRNPKEALLGLPDPQRRKMLFLMAKLTQVPSPFGGDTFFVLQKHLRVS